MASAGVVAAGRGGGRGPRRWRRSAARTRCGWAAWWTSRSSRRTPWDLPDAAEMLPHADARERLHGEVQGPESVALDPQGRGPYTGVADGRVVFWDGEAARWVPFATASPRWTDDLCGRPKASPLEYLPNKHVCGRPLGLRFDKGWDLYIADAYFGLLKVGPEGGLATPLATEAEGVRFNFTYDLDLDDEGNVYLTDSSIHHRALAASTAYFLHALLKRDGRHRDSPEESPARRT